MELGQRPGCWGLCRREGGYAMAALLVGLSVLAVLMSMALPVWSQFTKREREEELIWRGRQYMRAVELFQRKYANTFPPTIDILVEQRFLRKKYKDPVTNDDFQPIPAGGGGPVQIQDPRQRERQGAPAAQIGLTLQSGGGATSTFQQPSIGIQGVVSKSKASSVKMYNGRMRYNEWAFVHLATAQRPGVGGVQQPGVPGVQRPGVPGAQPGGPQMPGSQPGTTFTPMGGRDRRPGIGPQLPPQSPFSPPPPFGAPRQPNQPPTRPPGS